MAFASPPPSLLVLIARSAACGSSSLLAAALHRAADVMARAEHDGACAPCAAAPAPAQQRQSAALQALVLVPAWAASDAMPAVSALPALQRRDWAAADAAAGGAAVAPLLRRLVRAQGIAHFHSALSRLRLVSVASLADVTANLARVHAPAWAPTPASSPEPAAPVVPAAAAVPASAAAADAQVWRVLEISPAPARASAHELPAAPMIVVVHGLDALVERTCGGGGGGDAAVAAAAAADWSSAPYLSATARCVALASAMLARSAELWHALAAAAVQRGGASEVDMAAAAAALPRPLLCLTLVSPAACAAARTSVDTPPSPFALLLARLGACVHDVDDVEAGGGEVAPHC